MPPMPPKEKKSKIWLWVLLGVCGLSLIVRMVDASDNSTEQAKEEISAQQVSKEEWTNRLIDDLNINDEYMDSVIQRAEVTKSPEMLAAYVRDMNNIADKVITDSLYMDVYDTPEVFEKMEKNSKKANKILPKLKKIVRAKYVKVLSEELWEHNIYVESSGTTITFIGGVFANNKNIKDWQAKVETGLKELGFTQVRYKWIKHADEYTYYDL